MAMPHPLADWTVAQVLELPDDGNRYEVVDGELLVSPAPALPHQLAIQALFRRLDPFVAVHRLGCVLLSPADIEFDERTCIVDLEARLIERWQPADERPEILAERIEWRPSPDGPCLAIDLGALFGEVLDT